MSAESRSPLKGHFNTGDKPTEAQFANLIDSGLNLTDGGTVVGATTFSTHITASGNISASGTIFASRFESAGASNEVISFNDNLNLTGNLTASGNISSSGNIIGTNITVTDDLFIKDSIFSVGADDPSIKLSTGATTFDVEIGDVAETTNETIFKVKDSTNSFEFVNGNVTITSATGLAAGGGIDAVSPTINVSRIGRDIVTEVFIDIGAGLILSSGATGDVIGEDGVAAAFLTRITTGNNGLVYAGEIVCLEVPTTGDPDINVAANASGTIAEDAAGEGEHVLANCGVHTLALKTAFTIPAGGIVNDFIYLTHGGTTAGTYNAGKFLLRFFGTPTS